jgi:2-hydroxycyclohexanecarboxyl-CoA dehydrogenase
MFTRTLALEVSRFGIRANCVTPSIVRDTISHERVMAGELSRKVFEKAEARARLGVPTPRDVAPLVVFLASPLSARITGQAVSVNGGISAA